MGSPKIQSLQSVSQNSESSNSEQYLNNNNSNETNDTLSVSLPGDSEKPNHPYRTRQHNKKDNEATSLDHIISTC